MGYEDLTKGGWYGNWVVGERPEGYVRTTARYLHLKSHYGFSMRQVLGTDFARTHNEIVNKAQQGKLSQSDLETLLKQNREFLKAMDDFEKSKISRN